MVLQTFFSGGDIDRQSWLRSDAAQLDAKLAAATTRFVVTSEARCLVAGNAPLLLQRQEVEALADPDDSIYLGIRGEHDLFVLDLAADAAGTITKTRDTASFSASLWLANCLSYQSPWEWPLRSVCWWERALPWRPEKNRWRP